MYFLLLWNTSDKRFSDTFYTADGLAAGKVDIPLSSTTRQCLLFSKRVFRFFWTQASTPYLHAQRSAAPLRKFCRFDHIINLIP